jgi:hypothetical protein
VLHDDARRGEARRGDRVCRGGVVRAMAIGVCDADAVATVDICVECALQAATQIGDLAWPTVGVELGDGEPVIGGGRDGLGLCQRGALALLAPHRAGKREARADVVGAVERGVEDRSPAIAIAEHVAMRVGEPAPVVDARHGLGATDEHACAVAITEIVGVCARDPDEHGRSLRDMLRRVLEDRASLRAIVDLEVRASEPDPIWMHGGTQVPHAVVEDDRRFVGIAEYRA